MGSGTLFDAGREDSKGVPNRGGLSRLCFGVMKSGRAGFPLHGCGEPGVLADAPGRVDPGDRRPRPTCAGGTGRGVTPSPERKPSSDPGYRSRPGKGGARGSTPVPFPAPSGRGSVLSPDRAGA